MGWYPTRISSEPLAAIKRSRPLTPSNRKSQPFQSRLLRQNAVRSSSSRGSNLAYFAGTPSTRTPAEKMDHNVEVTVDEDFHNRPSKKAKCSESSVLESDEQINGDPFTSPPSPIISTSSPVSESSETSGFKSDEQINDNLLSSLPSSTMSTLSPVSGLMNEEKVSLDDDKQSDEHKQIEVDERYDYLPQDYALTERDLCAHVIIETSSKNDLLVKIDDISVKQHQLVCLLDESKWLNDDVISAYICCIKDQAHVQNKNDGKVYFENPFISRLLKRDGSIRIHEDGTFMTDIVRNYLKYDMIELPINIYNKHWYLAIVNAKKSEIQVLDSLCWEFDRNDLTVTLRGLQYHLDILRSQQDLISHKWTDLDVTKWTITEQLREPIQEDSSSCGLFMLKFMEYFTEDTLSHPITQEIITPFRYKLASILLSWKTNTAAMTTMLEQRDYIEEDPNDVVMLESPDDQNKAKQLTSLSVENKYKSLISVISTMSLQALVGGLCDYIKSINSAENLEKVWVQSSKPYSISLTLKKLQEILNDDLPMDCNCFNLVVRKIMFDDIEMVKKKRGKISKHYLDMQFWVITDFGRHPKFRKKLDVEQLAYSVRSWPGINYSVSTCKSIHIPVQSNGDFIVFILDKDTRTIYILDPSPLDPIYQYNPHAKYVHKLLWIAEYLPKAMSKACPGSRWNENVFLWKEKILNNIPVHNRELSGYLVPLFMSTWEDEKLHLPFSKINVRDGSEVRKQTLGHLLAFKDNECEDNMPAGVLELVRCIKEAQRRSSIGGR